MTDYKNLKLIASSSPHIRSNEDTRSIMLDVIIALLPALAAERVLLRLEGSAADRCFRGILRVL